MSTSNTTQTGDSDWTGEYVIMAIDATNPPFVGKTIAPAFMVVKVNVPKKPKKVKKDPRPK